VLSWYQNVSPLDFTVAKDDGGGGDNWGYNTGKSLISTQLFAGQMPFMSPN